MVLEAVLGQAARLRAAPVQQAVHRVAMDRAVLVHQVDRAHPVVQAVHRVDRVQVHHMARVAIRDHPILGVVRVARVAVAAVRVTGLGMARLESSLGAGSLQSGCTRSTASRLYLRYLRTNGWRRVCWGDGLHRML